MPRRNYWRQSQNSCHLWNTQQAEPKTMVLMKVKYFITLPTCTSENKEKNNLSRVLCKFSSFLIEGNFCTADSVRALFLGDWSRTLGCQRSCSETVLIPIKLDNLSRRGEKCIAVSGLATSRSNGKAT